jgi:serine/threonine protein kinase
MLQLIDTIYGRGFHIMKPDVPIGHEDYDFKILLKYHQCFGPFPWTYAEIADEDTLKALSWIMHSTPPESLRPFHMTTSKEISEKDKTFIMRIMKLDPRDRPTAASLLEDKWFHDI